MKAHSDDLLECLLCSDPASRLGPARGLHCTKQRSHSQPCMGEQREFRAQEVSWKDFRAQEGELSSILAVSMDGHFLQRSQELDRGCPITSGASHRTIFQLCEPVVRFGLSGLAISAAKVGGPIGLWRNLAAGLVSHTPAACMMCRACPCKRWLPTAKSSAPASGYCTAVNEPPPCLEEIEAREIANEERCYAVHNANEQLRSPVGMYEGTCAPWHALSLIWCSSHKKVTSQRGGFQNAQNPCCMLKGLAWGCLSLGNIVLSSWVAACLPGQLSLKFSRSFCSGVNERETAFQVSDKV